MSQSILDDSIEAAETIVQCSQHIKCIVDGLSLYQQGFTWQFYAFHADPDF